MIGMLLRVSVMLVGVATIQALLHRRTSAATRHLMWTLSLVGLLVLPLLSAVLPGWKIPVYIATPQMSQVVQIAARTQPGDPNATASVADQQGQAPRTVETIAGTALAIASPTRWMEVLSGVYAAVVLFLLLRLATGRRAVRRLARHATEVGDPAWTHLLTECAGRMGVRRPVRLLRSREATMPMAFGIRRPAVLIPAIADMWSEDRLRAVLLHELAHVARHDCLTQLMAAVTAAVYWIHPGVWWIARRLRVERELACDDRVLLVGTSGRDYAEHLLELAYALGGNRAPALAVTMARREQLEGRMLAVLDGARNRAIPAFGTILAGAAITLALLVPLAAAEGTVMRTPAQGDGQAPPVTTALTGRPADDLVRAREHGVSPQYIRDLETLGFTDLSLDTLISARDHGISPEYVRELRALGYRLTLAELTKARDHGISAQYISELRELGHPQLSLDALVGARDHGISQEYIRELDQLGYRLTLADLTKARDHGVSAEYIHALAGLGYERLPLESLIRLRDHGVTPEYVQAVKKLGHDRLTVDELIGLRDRVAMVDKPGIHERIRLAIAHIRTMNVHAMFKAFIDRWMK